MKIKIITVDGSTLQQRVTKLLKGMEKDGERFSDMENYVKGCVENILKHAIVEVVQ